MTAQRLNQFMILTVSRAAQLVYTEEFAAAYAMLSDADRLFRYLAAPDSDVLLAEELEALRILLRLDPSLEVRIDPALFPSTAAACPDEDESWLCLFVRRLSVIDAVLELAAADDSSYVPASETESGIPPVRPGRPVADSPGERSRAAVAVTPPPPGLGFAVLVARGASSLGVGCA
ncbi:MAG: hypothetical protein M0Z80_08610 [Treponema sp.]|nr:hypothetical protein [Treponema sp.]